MTELRKSSLIKIVSNQPGLNKPVTFSGVCNAFTWVQIEKIVHLAKYAQYYSILLYYTYNTDWQISLKLTVFCSEKNDSATLNIK